MSTILHPCLESQFKETAKLVKLKVAAPPKPKSMEFGRTSIENRDEFNQLKMKNLSSNTTEHGGWTFLQAISSIPKETMDKENNIYIHPLSRYASPRLSEKSLQLCTENLGCETGSFWMDTNILSLTSYNYSLMEANPATKEVKEQKQSPKQMDVEGEGEGDSYSYSYSYSSIKKVKPSRELPPPLTTMSGEKSLQVKTHREDGRLIIQAIEKPLKESCFLAERSEGCLKLFFLKDIFTKVDMQQKISPEGNEAEKEEADIKNENENKDDDPGENEESQNQENEEIMSKEYVGNSNINDIDVENMVKEKFQRFGRCQECGNSKKKMCNWEPVWVATS